MQPAPGAGQPGAPVSPPAAAPFYPLGHPPQRPRVRRGRFLQGSPGAPVQVVAPSPSAVASWGSAQAVTLTLTPEAPVTASLPVPVANTAGDWMAAAVGWRQPAASAGVSVSVGDDAHNWWDPAGAPTADSPAAGVTRCAIWAAPAARAATTVMAAPTGHVQGLAMTVIDIAGMAPWRQDWNPGTSWVNAGQLLTLGVLTPSAMVLVVVCAASDNLAAVISGPGSGWAVLPAQTASNGTDHTADIQLNVAWRATTAAAAAAWAASAGVDFSGAIAAFVASPAAPVAANPNWPIVETEIAPGAGPATPPSQLPWVRCSARSLALTAATQGQQYTYAGLQAGQGTVTLDNPDGALIPPGTGIYAGIDSGTPLRVRAIWPASATPHNVVWSGFLQQLPQSWDQQLLRGTVAATVTDAWGYATRSIPPALRTEVLYDSPYALWPLTDPAGSAGGANYAPGNQNPLLPVASKYGTGGATYAFGGGATLKGDSGSGTWSEASVPAAGNQGWSLNCQDSGYPPLSGPGVTVEGWFQATSFPTAGGSAMLTLTSGAGPILWVSLASGGQVKVTGNSPRGLSTIVSCGLPPAGMWHIAVTTTRTTYVVFLNGIQVAAGGWALTLAAAFSGVWANGAFPAATGSPGPVPGLVPYNGSAGYAAITPGALAPARVMAHYQAGALAFNTEAVSGRVERLLAAGGLTGRRVILPDPTHMASLATTGGSAQALTPPGTPGFTPGGGTTCASALQQVAASTSPAVLTMAPTGDVVYLPRSALYDQTAKWVLGDNPAGGEIPFAGTIVFGWDPALVKNDVQMTQPDTGVTAAPAVSEAASQGQYGPQSYSVTATLAYDVTAPQVATSAGLGDLASWVAATSARPQLRASNVTVDAARYPAAWPFVLGCANGDVATVNLRPPTSPGVVISVTGRITQTTRDLTYSADSVTGSVQVALDASAETGILTTDDPVRGQLTGANILGW